MSTPPDPAGTVELRVHGVSGTPVSAMLDVSVVRRVAGDDGSGFWRRGEFADPEILQHYAVQETDGTTRARDVTLEGYRWGGLTSGAAKVAVWLLFAPFALVNVAAAAHMPGRSKPEARRGIAPGVEGGLIRLFALSLSFTLVFAVYISAVDVVGWQCGRPSTPGGTHSFCTRHTSYTHFLFWHFVNTPAKHIVVTMLVPIGVIALVWKLASQSWQRYEAFPPGPSLPVLNAEDDPPPDTTLLVRAERERTPFDDPAFWNGRERTEMLRHLHVAACLAALSAMVAAAWIGARRDGTSTVLPVLILCLALALSAVGVVFTAIGTSPARRQTTYVVLAASGVLLVVTLAAMWRATLGTQNAVTGAGNRALPAELPAVGRTVTILFAVQLALILAVFGAGLVANTRSKAWKTASNRSPGLNGLTSSALCMLALVVAGMFAAGVILRVADIVGVPRARAEIGAGRPGQIVTPDVLMWVARATVVAAALLVLRLLWVGLPILWSILLHPRPRTQAPPPTLFTAGIPDDPALARQRRQRDRAIQRATDIAALTDRAGTVVGPAMVLAFVAAAVATGFAVYGELTKGGWAVVQDDSGFLWRVWTASAGSWLILGSATLIFATTLRAYRNPDRRRQVGILWDVATFWPRSAHPWAPPCYAERTVPEYAVRATFLRYEPTNFTPRDEKLVLSAHSQGTIIAAASLLQLGSTDGIGLVTYGCPLDRLYAKYFPAYFGGPTLEILHDRMHGAWRNLSRETDPIGGPVKIAAHPEVDVDVPIPVRKNPGDPDYPAIEGHSRYPREPVYADQLLEVRDLL
jgi:hypothetical protein